MIKGNTYADFNKGLQCLVKPSVPIAEATSVILLNMVCNYITELQNF